MRGRRSVRRRRRIIMLCALAAIGLGLWGLVAWHFFGGAAPSSGLVVVEATPTPAPEATPESTPDIIMLPADTPDILTVPVEAYTPPVREIIPVPKPSPTITPPPAPSASGKADFAFYWFTDVQYYASKYPEKLYAMTSWMKENIDTYNVKYAIATGDFVDSNRDEQWQVVDKAMEALDESLPYIAIAGNHDVGTSTPNYSSYLKRFGKNGIHDSRFAHAWLSSGKGRCDLFSIGGTDFMILGYGWGVDISEGNAWLNKMLRAFPERNAILIFHDYMTTDGLFSSAGESIYKRVVKPNPNVFLVLCGHRYNCSLLVTDIDDDGDNRADRSVYHAMMNYQAFENGGDGYLTLIRFYKRDRVMTFDTYSPVLDDWYYFDPERGVSKEHVVMPVGIFD